MNGRDIFIGSARHLKNSPPFPTAWQHGAEVARLESPAIDSPRRETWKNAPIA